MATYDIMPPPATTEKALGEERVVNFTGAGLSLGEEIDVEPLPTQDDGRDDQWGGGLRGLV